MRDSHDVTELQQASPTPDEDDIYGIARYLADSVLDGEITFDDGAHALAEWADKSVLAEVAAHLSPGSDTDHLVQAATEWRAA